MNLSSLTDKKKTQKVTIKPFSEKEIEESKKNNAYNVDIKTLTSESTSKIENQGKGFFEPTEEVRVRDFVREFANVSKNVLQEIPRNIGSAGVTLGSAISKATGTGRISEANPPEFLEPIMRDEPIKSVEQRIADAEIGLKRWADKNKDSKVRRFVGNNALSLAFTGILADTGLDLTPFGGSKNAIKSVKKIDNFDDAFSALKKMKVDDDIAKKFSKDVVESKTDDAAKKVLTKIADAKRAKQPKANVSALKRTKKTKEATKTQGSTVQKTDELDNIFKGTDTTIKTDKEVAKVSDNILKNNPDVSKKDAEDMARDVIDNRPYNKTTKNTPAITDDLYQEARKYDSAEEFVENQGKKVYHGTGEKFNEFKLQNSKNLGPNAIFFSPQKEVAEYYARGKTPDIKEAFLKSDNIFDYKNKKDVNKLIDYVKNKNPNEIIGSDTDFTIDEIIEDIINGRFDILETETVQNFIKKEGYDGFKLQDYTGGEAIGIFDPSKVKTKSQLKDIWQKAQETKATEPQRNLPAVIRGETFTLKQTKGPTKPTKGQLKKELKATQKEIKNARIAEQKAAKLEAKKQKIRQDALENIHRYAKGNTDKSIERLKKKNLSDEDIENIILEDGTKLVDTVKVKRNADGSLATTITKKQLDEIKTNYKGETPERWVKKQGVQEFGEWGKDIAQIYELPQLFFERKGLKPIYDKMIEGDRAAEVMKTDFLKRFKEAGLFKEGGWFTADRFKLNNKESDRIGKYYLSRQKKGYKINYDDLSDKEKKFVDIFDNIIKETEPRFFEVAKKNGKTPGAVEDYAPIMTRDDIKRIDNETGTMDFITRKHPAFSSTKERAKRVPKSLYETDYRKVASRWLEGVTKFNTVGDVSQDVKYLIDSDQFKNAVNPKDYETIYKWFQDSLTPRVPTTHTGKAVTSMARLLRTTAAMASLGLNYASVLKQTLTLIPTTIISKARPKMQSDFAKAFNLSVDELPSLSARKGNIAISDLQGKIGRIFTGPLTKFDKMNAQKALNGLLDKEYKKYLKQGEEISQETVNIIQKKAQDDLDLWFGGMVSTGQRPEAFRSELGKFINMFIYPLTSQLNGFYRHIYQAKGAKNAQAIAEVAAAATAIAYMEQTISNLSPQWSDKKEMTSDILQSLAGNIPILGNIAWAYSMDDDLSISPGIDGINKTLQKIKETSEGMAEPEELGFAFAEMAGLPRQFRDTFYEGMQIVNEGGITDKSGKMLAPVRGADEIMRSVINGKYGSIAAKDWIRNIGEKSENRRWFVPEIEFLQNGDYDRKAELYKQFDRETRQDLMQYLSEGQKERLENKLGEKNKESLDDIFLSDEKKEELDSIFK